MIVIASTSAAHSPADRGDDVGLRPREIAGAAREAGWWCRGDPRRWCHQSRGQGKEGPGRRRHPCDEGGGRGRHRSRRRVALLYAAKALDGLTPENNDQKVGIDIVKRASRCLFISNMVTLSLPKTLRSSSSARISRRFSAFCRLCERMYSHILLTTWPRASGLQPTTAASSCDGC